VLRLLAPARLALCLLVVGAMGAAAAEAPPPAVEGQAAAEKPAASGDAVLFSLRAMVFVFFHELGHALVSELDLPVVGPEEDVVDEFAAFLLIAGAREAEGEDRVEAYRVLREAAGAWRLMWVVSEKVMRRDPAAFPFWDEHNLDIRRYYNIVCLLYGSDPEQFRPLLRGSGIPAERAAKCAGEYRKKWAAWQKLMKAHLIGEGAPAGAGRFKVVYGDAGGAFAQQMQAIFKEYHSWETLTDPIPGAIAMPHDLTVTFKSCGALNSWWDPRIATITLCYELMNTFARLYAADAEGRLEELATRAVEGTPPAAAPKPPAPGPPEPNPPAQSGPLTAPPAPAGPVALPAAPPPQAAADPPAAQPAPATMDAMEPRFVGVWQAQSGSGAAQALTRLTLRADGSFLQTSYGAAMAPFSLWGRATVSGSRMQFTVAGWEPLQSCDAQRCQPIEVRSQSFAPFQFLAPAVLQLGGSLFYRVQ
jgi:hypothetical protein